MSWKLIAANAVAKTHVFTKRYPWPIVNWVREHNDHRPVPEICAVGDAAEIGHRRRPQHRLGDAAACVHRDRRSTPRPGMSRERYG